MTEWSQVLASYERICQRMWRQQEIVISGGEPTFSGAFLEMLSLVAEVLPTAQVVLLTNGSLLSEELLEAVLSRVPRNRLSVQLSLDGWNEETHDAMRCPGSFEQVCAAQRLLLKKRVRTAFNVTLNSHTAKFLPELFVFAQSKGVTELGFSRFIPGGANDSTRDEAPVRGLTKKELRNAYELITRMIAISKITVAPLPLMHFFRSDKASLPPTAATGLTIMPDGEVRIASRVPVSIGNIHTRDLESLYFDSRLIRDLQDANNFHECSACEHWHCCGGDFVYSQSVTGSFFAKDPLCFKEYL